MGVPIVNNELTFDFAEEKAPITIYTVQGDNDSRSLSITLTLKGVPVNLTGCTVTVNCNRSDGKLVEEECTIVNATAGKVAYSFSDVVLLVEGFLLCNIAVKDNDDRRIGTQEFTVYIGHSPANVNSILDSSEYTILTVQLRRLDEILQRWEQIEGMDVRAEVESARGSYNTLGLRLDAMGTGSGGTGTSDYTQLVNKPSINSIILTGNKTLTDLGVASATHTHTGYLTNIPSEYITETELTSKGYLTSYTETDPTVPTWAKQSNKPSYSYVEITNKPTLSTVATTGSYNDLINKPVVSDGKSITKAVINTSGNLILTLSDNSTIDCGIAKGDKGDNGAKGDNGYTPIRGTDYWTTADINTINGYINTAVSNAMPSVTFNSATGTLTITD